MRSASSPPRDQISPEAARGEAPAKASPRAGTTRADDFLVGRGLTVKTWWTLPNHRKSGNFRRPSDIAWQRMLRRAARRGGVFGPLIWKKPREKQAPWVILCDVSGSMQQYWDFYGAFFAAVLASVQPAELFTFGTRIDSATRSPANSQGIIAQSEVGAGTLIGEALRQWQQRWGRDWLRPRTVLWIISDGWDAGDPATAARELARIRSQVARIVWINPWMGTPGFRPATRTLKAARPYVRFVKGRTSSQLLEAMQRL